MNVLEDTIEKSRGPGVGNTELVHKMISHGVIGPLCESGKELWKLTSEDVGHNRSWIYAVGNLVAKVQDRCQPLDRLLCEGGLPVPRMLHILQAQ